MNSRKFPVMSQNREENHNAEDIAQIRNDVREIVDRLGKLERWQSFVLGATAAFWVFMSFISWWLSQK